MHLMSFYATPYASRHREAHAARKRNIIRASWFIGGIAFGIGAAYMLFSGESETPERVVQTEKPAISHQIAAGERSNAGSADAEAKLLAKLKEASGGTVEEVLEQQVSESANSTSWPKTIELEVQAGDIFVRMLTNKGVSHIAAHRLAKQVSQTYDLTKLRPGDKMTAILEQDNDREMTDEVVEALEAVNAEPTKLRKLTMYISKLEHLEIETTGSDEYRIQKIKKKLVTEQARAKTSIEGSLDGSLARKGVPRSVINRLTKNYSYDVDFQRDIKMGDEIDLMYEHKKTEEGDIIAGGHVLYSSLITKGRTLKQYRFKDEHGIDNYYNEKGQNIVKKLLKTPVDGARVSSNFGMRKHPILGYSRMHTGIDFAAPRGTKIYAAGDGTVTYSGYKGSYGKYVSIKHNSTYSTAYAHAHRIAKGIKKGTRVKQGQVIAYVGSTGRSTGPHLHYEILRNGRHVNPKNVKFTGGNELRGKQLAAFKKHVKSIKTQLANMPHAAPKAVAEPELAKLSAQE